MVRDGTLASSCAICSVRPIELLRLLIQSGIFFDCVANASESRANMRGWPVVLAIMIEVSSRISDTKPTGLRIPAA
jgi:hypothetical protein